VRHPKILKYFLRHSGNILSSCGFGQVLLLLCEYEFFPPNYFSLLFTLPFFSRLRKFFRFVSSTAHLHSSRDIVTSLLLSAVRPYIVLDLPFPLRRSYLVHIYWHFNALLRALFLCSLTEVSSPPPPWSFLLPGTFFLRFMFFFFFFFFFFSFLIISDL